MRLILLVPFICSAALTGCDVNTTVTTTHDEEKTREVLDHHMAAFQANDLEATMSDYTAESILITPDNTAKGLEQIRSNFEGAFKAFPRDSITMTVTKTVVNGDVAYIIWQATTPTFKMVYATDTFIIKNGKITRQTFAGMAEPL
jgi:uncharacterized protein (TIGR02246 family)